MLSNVDMDFSEEEMSALTNEEYLSARAKMLMSSGRDPLGARAWLTTAKMIFPNNFEIQYEAYLLEKNENQPNIKKAAKLLANLFENFGVGSNKGIKEQDLERLWEEIDEMTSLLRTPGRENDFLFQVFESMPKQCRQKILIECALRQSELQGEGGHVERIRILMLAFHKFPDLIKTHGSECLEYTIEQCKNNAYYKVEETEDSVKDEHTKHDNEPDTLLSLLVNEISPLLLSNKSGLSLDTDVLFDLISLTIQFVLSKLGDAQSHVRVTNSIVKGNLYNDSKIPWSIILKSLEEIGERMGWQLTRNLSQIADTLHHQEKADQLWQRILAFNLQTLPQATNGSHVSADPLNQIFYTGTLLFLKHLSEYVSISTNSNIVHINRLNHDKNIKEKKQSYQNEAILVEGFVTHVDDSSRNSMQHPLKRRRTTEEERKYPLITHGGQNIDPYENVADEFHPGGIIPTLNNTNLVRSFKAAIKYYELLKSDANLNKRLQKILQQQKNTPNEADLNHHETLVSFYADYQLYQGHFREALQYLRQITAPIHQEDSDTRRTVDNHVSAKMCRLHIRMASVHFCMGEHQFVADQIIQAVSCLQQNYTADDENKMYEESVHIPESRTERERIEKRLGRDFKQASIRSRHIHFLPFSRQSILSYCCRLLIHILKDRSLKADIGNTTNDFAIGHVIVLLQYCYPEEKDLLHLLLHRIRMKETFSYPIFCNYVVHIQFLEEFAQIVNASSTNSGAAPMGSAPGGTGVILDICPQDLNKGAESVGSSRRLGTRGANKGEKVELRAALKRQVARSYENLDQLIADFLTKNRDSIFQCLL